MVTVIANPEEFSSPVQNGVNNVSNDLEGNFHYIKDYQEVDFHRSPSCKPLPEDLLTIINDPQAKSSINGVFFVQIDAIESMEQSNQNGSIDGNKSLMMRITDGCVSVHALTMDEIPHLNFNVKPGCKLLITGVIPIENGLLQLTHDNTHFQFGSRTYPRPRSAYRGRGGGSNRPSYEGRRGGGNNGYNRQEQHSTETNFFKRPPAKNTLMDFMTTLKISRDSKLNHDEEKSKMKENFSETKRRAHEWTKSNNNGNLIQSDSNNNYSTDQPVETTDSSEGVTSESTEIHEQLDSEDDPSQAIYRERRNPLPPRLQRAQEERSRRNTIRHQDEINLVSSEEINGDYRNGTTHHPLMSSSSSSSAYARRSDPRSYISNNLSLNQPHPTPSLHPYGTHPALLPTMSNSGTPYLSYFPPNSAHLGYTMAGGPFANAQANMLPNYLHDNFTLSYGNPYGPVTYLQPPMTNGYNDEMKSFSEATNPSVTSTGSSNDENEITVINESQIDETNESENQSQSSFAETKPIATTSSSPLSSSNDENSSARKTNNEPFDRKVRDSTSNPRPRWKINDVCFARWKEDNQFYLASIVQIRPPFCTVVFLDYQNYDDVHFADLKPIPRDQPNPSVLNPVTVATSELNPLAANASFSMRSDYYPMGLDGYVVLPEVPPFPYNAAGTIYMYPTAIPVLSRSNRSTSFGQPMSQRRYDYDNSNHYQENSEMTIDSNSSMSKDSNEISINDSTATSIDDIQRHEPVRGTEKISSDATATPGTDSSSSSDKHDETSGNVAENL